MCAGMMGGDDGGDGAGGAAGDESMALPCHGSLALSHIACFSFFASARLSPFSTFSSFTPPLLFAMFFTSSFCCCFYFSFFLRFSVTVSKACKRCC